MVAYGIYVILGLALPFLFVPGLILPLVGMAAPTDVWVHVLGMTVLFLGFYYIQMGRNELTQFMRWSVVVRLLVPVFFLAFVLVGWAPPVLIAFVIPDIFFALWTGWTLRGYQAVSKRSAMA
jgi:uncharacterized membrane protein